MNILKKVVGILGILLFPTIIVLVMHYIEISAISGWVIPDFMSFIISYIWILLVALLLSAIFNNTIAGTGITSVLGVALSCVSRIKFNETGEVLTIFDFNFLRDIKQIISMLKPEILLFPLFLIVGIIIVCILLRKKKRRFNIYVRLAILICIPILISTIFLKVGRQTLINVLGSNITSTTQTNDIRQSKGILASFYLQYAIQKEANSSLDDIYTKERIFSILDGVKEAKTSNLEQKPNVIVIMSEAFMDITTIPGLEFSSDPLPTIHKLMDEYISGTAITSSYGNSTANMEFELLTGNTVNFYPNNYVVYRSEPELFNKDIYSISKIVKQEGYRTVAIHPYQRDFYNRDEIYPKLGIDEYYAEDSYPDAPRANEYISDDFLIEQVIKQYEEKEGPKFIMAVSMQNHYPYDTNSYKDESPVTVTSKRVNKGNLNKVQAYVHGLCDVDASIKKLIDYLETQDEPTVVLFFGDHFPLLTRAFIELGYMPEVEAGLVGEELYEVRKIPYFIYNNFGHSVQYEKNQNTTWNKLGSFLLSYIGIDKPIYYDFVDNLKLKVMYNRLFIDKNDNIYTEPTFEYIKEIEDYKLLQYDLLYGNQYIREWEEKK